MSDQLLLALRVCLLALVYLVFFRVLRAVWVELRTEQGLSPAPVAGRKSERAATFGSHAPRAGSSAAPMPAARLRVVAPPELAGRVYALDPETTIGRGRGCVVAVDDAHVSKLHARLFRHEEEWFVEDLGSTNGTLLDGTPVISPTPVPPGGRIGVGSVELELA